MKQILFIAGLMIILSIRNRTIRLRILWVFSIAFAICLVVSCSPVKPKPEVVQVPVSVPCVKDKPERPTYYFENLGKPLSPAEEAEQVRILWMDKEAAIRYGDALYLATAGCQEVPK